VKTVRGYVFEIGLLVAVVLISVAGFWNIYFGADADPQPHHHLHFATVFTWMGLLLVQLILIVGRRYQTHRKWGLAVLVAGPLLVATTAMLAVRSAQKGVASGEGDFMIIQNTMTTLVLGLLIFLAFLLKSRRKLHGSLLFSTTIIFMGIALFFALTSFVPPFRIEGSAFESEDPGAFYKFQLAGVAGQVTCLLIGFAFLMRDPRNGWPFVAAALCFPLNDAIFSMLMNLGLIAPLTELVGSMSQPLTFMAVLGLMAALLGATAWPRAAVSMPRPASVAEPIR
jgi:hypothetical protein